jgi:hypothetical protein
MQPSRAAFSEIAGVSSKPAAVIPAGREKHRPSQHTAAVVRCWRGTRWRDTTTLPVLRLQQAV